MNDTKVIDIARETDDKRREDDTMLVDITRLVDDKYMVDLKKMVDNSLDHRCIYPCISFLIGRHRD